MILKLESLSYPVATSLKVSMALHQPATFPFPSQFSKSKSVVRLFQASWFITFIHGVALLHYHEVSDSNSTFCFVRMYNGKQREDGQEMLTQPL